MQLPFPAKWVKVGERGLVAGLVAFASTYLPAITGAESLSSFADMSLLQRAASAGVTACAMWIVSALGLKVGDPESPSVLGGMAKDSVNK